MPRYNVTIDEKEYDIELVPGSDGMTAKVNGKAVAVRSHRLSDTRSLLMIDNQFHEVDIHSGSVNGHKTVFMTGAEVEANVEDYNLAQLRKTAGMASVGAAESTLKAPMPGLIVEVKVATGEKVKKGMPLLVIEAMKMENIIKAKGPGVVKAISVSGGEAVEKGDTLLEFE